MDNYDDDIHSSGLREFLIFYFFLSIEDIVGKRQVHKFVINFSIDWYDSIQNFVHSGGKANDLVCLSHLVE